MNQVDGKKIINFTDELSLPPDFSNPVDAIRYAKYIDNKRKSELNLDLTILQGRCVTLFHWNDQNLILEFEKNLYLQLTIENQLLSVQIINKNLIITDRNIIYEKNYSKDIRVLFKPQDIAQKYYGKKFLKIQLGERYAYLYFQEMPLLIFCMIHTIKESNKLFLSWDESE